MARTFGPDAFDETPLSRDDDLRGLRASDRCVWIDVVGLGDAETIASIGGVFGLHALSIEDVLEPEKRPKTETYADYIFVVLKNLSMSPRVEAHYLHLFFGERFVITLREKDVPGLDPVRDRLRDARGTIRSRGADYLAYAIIDAAIDSYFPVLEAFDDHLESVEDAVLEANDVDAIELARRARQDLQTVRHAVWPAREAVSALLHEDVALVAGETRIHLRDCYDHIAQLQEMVEASREITASLLESYISRVSLKTNEVMKVLTVIATIFIPLTFITGVYGMNFDPFVSPLNMPELLWYWGYPFSLLLMLGIVVGTLLYFRKKGWFGARGASRSKGR